MAARPGSEPRGKSKNFDQESSSVMAAAFQVQASQLQACGKEASPAEEALGTGAGRQSQAHQAGQNWGNPLPGVGDWQGEELEEARDTQGCAEADTGQGRAFALSMQTKACKMNVNADQSICMTAYNPICNWPSHACCHSSSSRIFVQASLASHVIKVRSHFEVTDLKQYVDLNKVHEMQAVKYQREGNSLRRLSMGPAETPASKPITNTLQRLRRDTLNRGSFTTPSLAKSRPHNKVVKLGVVSKIRRRTKFVNRLCYQFCR